MQSSDLVSEKMCSEGNVKASSPSRGRASTPGVPEAPDSTVSLPSSGPLGILSPHLPPPHSRPGSTSLQADPPSPSPSGVPGMRPNQVRSVVLNGVPIVSLVIDGKERLCLAQISNTLLKSFSYNEIHNRRVALGITCVQCTPVQLEILRRAGAMPISSRRCGMITKREAERLCKSFLTENCPPKLPDNFSFDCHHECAWGSRGNFMPSRYNSSRAKCIKCVYCNMFFSPNKFIFHSHRLPESKYVQPDAANFNSWRRHLKLSGKPPDEVMYAWEDVKAMFNGGSRKRVMAASCSRFHSLKRPRVEAPVAPPPSGLHSVADKALTYVPMLPYPNSKSFNGNPYLNRPGPFPPSSQGMANGDKGPVGQDLRGPPSFVDYVWAGKPGPGPPLPPATYGFIWPRQQAMTPEVKLSPGGFYEERSFRDDTSDSSRGNCDSEPEAPLARRSLSSCSEADFRSSDNDEAASVATSGRRSKDSGFFGSLHPGDKSSGYCSAFRPVVRSGATTLHTVESLIRPTSTGHKPEVAADPFRAAGHYGPAPVGYFGCDRTESKDSCSNSSKSGDSDHLIDVEVMDDDRSDLAKKNRLDAEAKGEGQRGHSQEKGERTSWASHEFGPLVSPNVTRVDFKDTLRESSAIVDQARGGVVRLQSPSAESTDIRTSVQLDVESKKPAHLTKEELEEILLQETQARKRAEKQCELMKETFQEQVKREVSYREEITKQLEVVKETLCNELDQERKARFAVLQKLKEAHDALHHFSCKMLVPRQCADCSYKPIIPQ